MRILLDPEDLIAAGAFIDADKRVNATGIVGFPRYTGEAAFSAGASVTKYPAAALGTPDLSYVWRSPDLELDSTEIVAVFPRPRKIGLVVVGRHNLSPVAQWRVRVYADAQMTVLLWDSGWLFVWPIAYDQPALDFEDDNWFDCTFDQAELPGTTWYRPMRIDPWQFGQAVRVSFDDRYNAAGHLQAGMLDVAFPWQLGVNFDWDAQIGAPSRSVAQEADGGSVQVRRRPKKRAFQGAITGMSFNEAITKGMRFQRIHDIDVPFFWWPLPALEKYLPDLSFMARNVDLGLSRWVRGNLVDFPLNLREA